MLDNSFWENSPVPVVGFQQNGILVLARTVPNSSHIWYDVCTCPDCINEVEPIPILLNKPKRKTSQKTLRDRYLAGDPQIGLLGEPSGKFDYYVLYETKKNTNSPPSTPSFLTHYAPPDWKPDNSP